MSNFSHRGYAQRTSGYSRRRHKGTGFRQKKKGPAALKKILIAVAVILVCGLIFIFVRYFGTFISSFKNQEQQKVQTADTPVQSEIQSPLEGYYDKVDNKVFVSDGAGYLMFKGIDKTALNYAAVLNSIASSMSDEVTLYSMVIPTNTEFGLAENLRQGSNSQRYNLDLISSSLMYNVHNIDIYSVLEQHKNEYIYYRTDQNLTSLGGYYAYLDYVQTMNSVETNDTPVYTLEKLGEKQGVIRRFEGELLQRTVDEKTQPHGNQDLFNNADTIVYYKLPVHYGCFRVDTVKGEYIEKDLFTEEDVKTDPLSVFPARNTEFMVATNLENNTEDKLLIVKDHAAEPVIGYLIPCYREVHIVDAELYKGGITEYIRDNKITDVLVINGIDDANNTLYCQRLRDLFDSSITD